MKIVIEFDDDISLELKELDQKCKELTNYGKDALDLISSLQTNNEICTKPPNYEKKENLK